MQWFAGLIPTVTFPARRLTASSTCCPTGFQPAWEGVPPICITTPSIIGFALDAERDWQPSLPEVLFPDTADYEVVLEPAGVKVGTVNEDFAIESMAGDIFQLGNTSWKIIRVEPGRVRVEDAKGQPPSIPFWLGEAPGRTPELSVAVSRLRKEVEAVLTQDEAGSVSPEIESATSLKSEAGVARATTWLVEQTGISAPAAEQIATYLAVVHKGLGAIPTQETLVLERFFDESGGMQLVVHSPFGSRLNRAWGLSLRKRFCRKFNFELQAAATEDAIVLSLGHTHSFPLRKCFTTCNLARCGTY